jgi:subtilisin family serine protease
MKLRKNIALFVSIIFFMAASTLLAGSKPISNNANNFQQLLRTAETNGLIRVLVEMNVPNIEELTLLSNQYKTGFRDHGLSQFALDADLQLENAINGTRETVLYRLNGLTYKVNRTFSTLPYMAITLTPDSLKKLNSIPEVIRVVEDELIPAPHISEIDNSADDLNFPNLETSTAIVGADVAWGFGYDGTGWHVAVLDTGLRNTHEMFQGKSIVEQCYSSGEDTMDAFGDCPNGLPEMSGPGSARPYTPQDAHGTHVAGTAVGNNHNGRYGVARGAGIIAVQVFSFFPSYGEVLSWSSDQLKGLEWVYMMRNTYNIASVNMSLGGSAGYASYCPDSSRSQAIANLRAVGIATTVASGNEARCGQVSDPACAPDAVTVGATDKSDNAYTSGNWDDVLVDVLAPGVSINSSGSISDDHYYGSSGTSMAAPHVAGAWAIIKQYDPTLTWDEILTTIRSSGQIISNGRCSSEGSLPRLNVGDALTSLFSLAPPLEFSAEQETNRSFLQTEYVNVLSWAANPLNQNKNVTHYRVYLVNPGDILTMLAEVNSSTTSYWHRNQERRVERTYAVTAVDGDGQESPPRYFTLSF